MEIRTFACAMAATGAQGGKVLNYEAAYSWITGMGFAELTVVSS